METKTVLAGEALFRIGDEDNCIYVVQSGKMNVYITEGVGGWFHTEDSAVIILILLNTERALQFTKGDVI